MVIKLYQLCQILKQRAVPQLLHFHEPRKAHKVYFSFAVFSLQKNTRNQQEIRIVC